MFAKLSYKIMIFKIVILLFSTIFFNIFVQILPASTMSKMICYILAICFAVVSSKSSIIPRQKTLNVVTALWQDDENQWTQLQQVLSLINSTNHKLIIATKPELAKKVTHKIVGFKNKPAVLQIKYEFFKEIRRWIAIHYDEKNDNSIDYLRMPIFKAAAEFDPFNSDQLVWIDLNFISNATLSAFVVTKGLQSMLIKVKYHFFFLVAEKKEDNFKFLFSNKTYFNTSITHFAGSVIFGGKKAAISTVCTMYEDLMKVVLYYDKNNWSQFELISILGQRSPYLISFLNIQNPTNTALSHSNLTQKAFIFQKNQKYQKNQKNDKKDKKEDNEENYQSQTFSISKYKFILKFINVIVIALILYQIFSFLNKDKNKKRHYKMESPQNEIIKIQF